MKAKIEKVKNLRSVFSWLQTISVLALITGILLAIWYDFWLGGKIAITAMLTLSFATVFKEAAKNLIMGSEE